jgi:hypothetical protein
MHVGTVSNVISEPATCWSHRPSYNVPVSMKQNTGLCPVTYRLKGPDSWIIIQPCNGQLAHVWVQLTSSTAPDCTATLTYGAVGRRVNTKTKTPWPESASELYRPSDRRISAKLLLTFADGRCHMVSVTDPYCRILCFLDRGLTLLLFFILA